MAKAKCMSCCPSATCGAAKSAAEEAKWQAAAMPQSFEPPGGEGSFVLASSWQQMALAAASDACPALMCWDSMAQAVAHAIAQAGGAIIRKIRRAAMRRTDFMFEVKHRYPSNTRLGFIGNQEMR
ncbi:MAG: hypothetical protein HZA59_05510 [Hydrogenophilales bacterium]|nr:hypothetical protein [Hydrogenophilales bacterium]